MQLDKTFIAVRERDYLEILDLALHVFRAFLMPLGLALLVGILPLALVSHFLIVDHTLSGESEAGGRALYTFWLGCLAAFAAPLAGAPATLLLGQVLFTKRPHVARIVRDLVGSLPQLLLFQVLLRGALFLPMITCFVPYVFWPYLTEIVLLERNPMWRGRHGRITTLRRSRALHSGSSGDLFGRWLFSVPLAVVLGGLLLASLWAMRQWVRGTVEIDRTSYILYVQFAVWSVVAFFTVVRFLGYLDLRIRREGWEVELKMRAEGAQLEHELV